LSNTGIRKNHRYLFAIHRQRRRNLRTNEASPNDREALALFGQLSQAVIVGYGSIVDDLVVAKGEASRRSPGSQE
jgi:hypothetical protein